MRSRQTQAEACTQACQTAADKAAAAWQRVPGAPVMNHAQCKPADLGAHLQHQQRLHTCIRHTCVVHDACSASMLFIVMAHR